MQLQPMDLVRGEVELPSLSDVFQQFTAKLDDPLAKSQDFAEIISIDPSLTAKVLKMVNSAYYSFSATITDIPHAITIIGLNELRELVLAISVVDFFDGLPNDLISMKAFWYHSILTGLLAKEINRHPSLKSRESVYTAGMLHDVGSLVFYNRLPEMAKSVLELSQRQSRSRYSVEKDVIGFDHAAIGKALIEHWGLPEFLIEVVAAHHQPEKSDDYELEAKVVNFADKIARLLEQDTPVDQLVREKSSMLEDVSEDHLRESIENAQSALDSVLSAVSIR